MLSTIAESFLADIIANPSDDVPRLIYADWLEDNGEEERAEFIRVQIRRHAGLFCKKVGGKILRNMATYADPKWEGIGWNCKPEMQCPMCDLERREKELILLCSYQWGEGWPRFERARMVWARGFVSEVHCTLADWCGFRGRGRKGQAAVACQPIEKVVLTCRQPRDYGPVENEFGWLRSGGSKDDGILSALPQCLFDLLSGGCFVESYSWYWYKTKQEALDALSAACLALARNGDRR